MRFGNSNSHFVAVENFAAQLHEMATSNFSFGQTLHQMNVDDNQSINEMFSQILDGLVVINVPLDRRSIK